MESRPFFLFSTISPFWVLMIGFVFFQNALWHCVWYSFSYVFQPLKALRLFMILIFFWKCWLAVRLRADQRPDLVIFG